MPKTGRDKEISEIVQYLRAGQVGRVFLGDANGEMSRVFSEEIQGWSRWKIKAERARIREYLRDEVKKFARNNFPNLKPLKLAELYEPLFNSGHLRMPLVKFEERVGGVRPGLFGDSPRHSTVHISTFWGLQTEFPEHYLMRDIAVLYNDLLELDKKLEQQEKLPGHQVKTTLRADVAETLRRVGTCRRMCLLACFNLIEAYINGLLWKYGQENDIAKLSQQQQKAFEGDVSQSLSKRLKVVSDVILKEPIPQNLLSDFEDVIKPYRNAIVHPSPFTVPEKFGGYDKLEKLYELNTKTVTHAVDVTEEIIKIIHSYIEGVDKLPSWFIERNKEGGFDFKKEVRSGS